MFKFIQSSPESKDCTACYNIELDKEYTLESFILTVLEQKKWWGAIRLENDTLFGRLLCEYDKGRLIGENMSEPFLTKRVTKAWSNGGWGSMNYYVSLGD